MSGVPIHQWWMCMVYRDNILVFCQDLESHRRQIDHILTLLGDADVNADVEEALFLHEEVEYLGQLICSNFLAVSHHGK